VPWRPRQHRPHGVANHRQHRAPHSRTTKERGYGWDWQQFRANVLAGEPLCQDCLECGVVAPAEELHHVVKIKDAPHLRLDVSNVRPLCGRCHDARTARGE
jgi:5-methylcytosine-specific restriction protein A